VSHPGWIPACAGKTKSVFVMYQGECITFFNLRKEFLMPSRLKQLSMSLESIVLEYYGPLPKTVEYLEVSGKKTQENNEAEDSASEAFHSDELQVVVSLEEHIQTVSAKKGVERATLMQYLAYGVRLINTCLENPFPLTEEASKNLKRELISLIVNMQTLSAGSKTEHIGVVYDNTESIIHGCNDCTSGNLIRKKLFLVWNPTSKDIEEYVTESIDEHQNALLVPALTAENSLLKSQNEQLVNENDLLEKKTSCSADNANPNEIAKLKQQVTDLIFQNKNLSARVEKLTVAKRVRSEHPISSATPVPPKDENNSVWNVLGFNYSGESQNASSSQKPNNRNSSSSFFDPNGFNL
jgi:hypothetical protein